MNAELPPFKNGEHNSESTSTIDRVITPLNICLHQHYLLLLYTYYFILPVNILFMGFISITIIIVITVLVIIVVSYVMLLLLLSDDIINIFVYFVMEFIILFSR